MPIATVVFAAIGLYIVVSLVMFLSANHVQYYQVLGGPLARNQTFRGIALRKETPVKTDTAGYVTYYAQGNTKVRRSGMLFGISAEKEEHEGRAMSQSALDAIRSSIREFSAGYDSAQYRNVYSLKSDIMGMIVADVPILTDEMREAASPGGTYTLGNETITASPQDGVVVYAIDGLENVTPETLEAENMDESAYVRTDLRTGERIDAGETVCKLVESEEWSLVIPLSPLQLVRLDGLTDIRVKFLSDGATQVAQMSILTPEDGTYYCRLDFHDGMIRYVDERFLDVELVTNQVTGLKVPISSIVSKEFFTIPEGYATEGGEEGNEVGFMREVRNADGTMQTEFVATTLYEHLDGKYYIDNEDFHAGDIIVMKNSDGDRYTIGATGFLEGVYCTNKGYALFRKIEILDKNEEYCIVNADTPYGISQFDFIVLNSDEVREDEIMVTS